MKRMQRMLARAVARLGPIGLAGLALIAIAATLHVTILLPAREEHDRLADRVTRLAARAKLVPPVPTVAAEGPEQSLSSFAGHFPPARRSASEALRLHALAARHGLRLASGEYRLVPEPGTDLLRYQITLPLKGTYPSVRAFLADSLAEVPTLAIDALALKRESAGVREVEGRVQLSLYAAGAP